MPDKLRMARAQRTAAKAEAAAKYQAQEQARAAFESATVPEGSKLQDLSEYQAFKDAKAEYDAAATGEVDADALVAELEPLAKLTPGAKVFGGIRPVIAGKYGPEETYGYKNVGEFIADVCFNPSEVAARGLEFRNEVSTTGAPEVGGFPLPTLFLDRILEAPTVTPIVRNHGAAIIAGGDMPDAPLQMRALNQTGAGNMFGGVEVYWEDEEADADASSTEPKTSMVTVQAKSVRAMVTETNKFFRNAGSASGLVERLLGNALVNSEDFKFLSGPSAAAAPEGVRNCLGMIYIHRQTAGTVLWEDVLAMGTALHPECRDRAVFVASQGLYPALRDIKDKAGNRVYWTGDPTKGVADTLDGIPVIYTGKVGAKGTKGDLILCDFSYYLIKEGMQPLISASQHALFKRDRMIVKINRSVDGKGWLTGPLVLEDGVTTVSPFVGLDLVSA
jgi:HK97 family phage major capsid protein